MDDWTRLIEEHPKVAFNWKSFDGNVNSPENGYEVLVQCEPWTNMPQNWDISLLRHYRYVITFNYLFYSMFKHVVNMIYLPGVLMCNTHRHHLNAWPGWAERLNGVCCLNNFYHLGTPGEILWLRPEVMANLPASMEAHVWCHPDRKWGPWQGYVETPLHHSHTDHLRMISQYRFCLCLESTYHPFWSVGFLTERILNCFKAKTVPIYMGCYDIEKYVPPHLFIDFRKYYSTAHRKYEELCEDLESITQPQWEAMTEEGYEVSKSWRLGSVENLEQVLVDLGV